ncbi:MAG: AEC family transporter [Paracoccaceae bacterium]|nr:AEC family transporter [Paracoccaceae bacterium]
MEALLDVIAPIFLLLAFGYTAVWKGLFRDESIDGLMQFTQTFALPCLLFRGISTLDLAKNFDPALLVSYYTGAIAGFVVAMLGAHYLFARRWEDSVAIGFCALFSNTLMLGIPITERAYGAGALSGNYAIISVHAPLCYGIGITTMELVINRGGGIRATARRVLRAMFRNSLVIGISLGLFVNLTGLHLPKMFTDALDLLVRAAVPAALFGLGGILYRYRPEGDFRVIAWTVAASLMLHPAVTWAMGTSLHLSTTQMRSAVVTASVAPGVNAYIFANMYGVAKRVAASTVLIATGVAVITVWFWLTVLGGSTAG